jgi:sugar lactone lactonase YvrE
MTAALLNWVALSKAQNLLQAPESVVYDSQHHRYLASNYGTGHIVAIDSQGQQSYFVQNQYCRNGLHISGNAVYAACIDQGIRGFNLDDAALVADVYIEGMVNLNDIASDTSGNLYVSDVYGSRIYRIRISDYSYTTFVDCGDTPPNGIYFDAPHNRLLVASFMISAPIMQVNLRDSSMIEVVYTGFNYLDGLTQDNDGNFYFSTWQTRSVYRYDSLFGGEPEFIYGNSNGPADIFFNKELNVLAVPVMNSNTVVFLQFPTAVGDSHEAAMPTESARSHCYPNPFNSRATIQYSLPTPSPISISIFDILGRKIETLAEGLRPAGENRTTWDARDRASGIYFYTIEAGDFAATEKMLLQR